MLDPIVESIEYRLLVFDFFPYGIWNVAHGRVRAAARTQHTGVPMPEMRSVPVHRRIGFLNDLFYARSHIAGQEKGSRPFASPFPLSKIRNGIRAPFNEKQSSGCGKNSAASLQRFEALLHLLGRDVLSVQRPALSKNLGAFEPTDEHRIETGVAN